MDDMTWREESESIQEAKSKNARKKFTCRKCRAAASAPLLTERARLEVCKPCFGKRKDLRRNELNDLSGSEWAQRSKSVEYYNGVRSEKQRAHGAAFPQSLAETHIEIFTKKGDVVLDPFVGVGTTSDAALALGRRSIGIELNPKFAALARQTLPRSKDHRVVCADVRRLRDHVKAESVDLVLTSPPYATLLKTVKGNFAYKWREHSDFSVVPNPRPYSTHGSDLGNLSYAEFMDTTLAVLKDCYAVLKHECYSVWVVKDYRDMRAGIPYVNFHGDVIRAAQQAGLTLWDIRIYDQTKFRPLVVLGYPSRNYYLNIGHSYVLIFKKHSADRKREPKGRATHRSTIG